MKKIDFRKIEVKNIEGKKSAVDISKELGNSIYQNNLDLGELELARSIYKGSDIEFNLNAQEIFNNKVKIFSNILLYFHFIKKIINFVLSKKYKQKSN